MGDEDVVSPKDLRGAREEESEVELEDSEEEKDEPT